MSGALATAVRSILGTEVVATQPVRGGCISDARRVELADGRVIFAKSGAGLPEDLLAIEAEGLGWLAEPGAIALPEVLGWSDATRESERSGTQACVEDGPSSSANPVRHVTSLEPAGVLLLEWVEPGRPQRDTFARLGSGLARLHVTGPSSFGWHRDGFIGSLSQANTPVTSDWPTFWFTRRIQPLATRALEAGSLDGRAASLVERLGGRLGELAGPPEPPARVHGDLWSGNVIVGVGGTPWLIDPAPYGGHREVDLAMLHLFGDPGRAFIDAYEEVAPLSSGWQERLPLWQLEPLLVHAVLFGGGYGAQARAVLERFT